MQRRLDWLGVFILVAVASYAQEPATVQFHFENQQLRPPKYFITLHEDGSGHFHAEGSPANPNDFAALPSEAQDRPIQLTAATTQRIFKLARDKKFFAIACESDAKVAFSGKKLLTYQGPDGHGACTYNYSRDTQIQWVTTQMEGVAATLEEGRRLELEHEHGRLSLDAELETLENMVQNGQATELGNIAPILVAIVKDDAVLERAQKRARHLLSIINAATPSH